MGNLTPEDLRIELYAGPLNAHGQIIKPIITEMQPVGKDKDAVYLRSQSSSLLRQRPARIHGARRAPAPGREASVRAGPDRLGGVTKSRTMD